MATNSYKFFVPGLPATAGSKRAIPFARMNGKLGVRVTDACERGKGWRSTVQAFALQAGVKPLSGPLHLRVKFQMPTPGYMHKGGKKNNELKANAPTWHTTKPDATKLLRAIEDALTGIAWHDDAQICKQEVEKVYRVNEVGALVQITIVGGES